MPLNFALFKVLLTETVSIAPEKDEKPQRLLTGHAEVDNQ